MRIYTVLVATDVPLKTKTCLVSQIDYIDMVKFLTRIMVAVKKSLFIGQLEELVLSLERCIGVLERASPSAFEKSCGRDHRHDGPESGQQAVVVHLDPYLRAKQPDRDRV